MGDGHEAGAVQRAVDQLEAGSLADARADGACLDGGVEGVDAVLADILDQPCAMPSSKEISLAPVRMSVF